MRAYGKEIVIGLAVGLKANPSIKGSVVRIYPFENKPNIMVRWSHTNALKTMSINDLRV